MTVRSAFGAEFAGAEGFLDTATYGLPPQSLVAALQNALTQWQSGTMDPASFDQPVHAARSAYAQLVGVPADTVCMGSATSAALALVAASIPDRSRVATRVAWRGCRSATGFPTR